jgi:hypothetical protein
LDVGVGQKKDWDLGTGTGYKQLNIALEACRGAGRFGGRVEESLRIRELSYAVGLWDAVEELLEIRKLSYSLSAAEELLVGSYKLSYALSLREGLPGSREL